MLLKGVMQQRSCPWAVLLFGLLNSQELAWGKAERQGRQAHIGVVMFGAALPCSGNLKYLRAILSQTCGATRARNCCLLMK